MRNLLVATDGSLGANRAVQFAASLAQSMGGRLTVLTVGGNTHLSRDELNQLSHVEGGIGDALEGMCSRVLAQAIQYARGTGATEVAGQVGWGDPSEAIVEAAQRLDVDAIVMGRRGLGRLGGLFLGSVSQKVASFARCPVITVP